MGPGGTSEAVGKAAAQIQQLYDEFAEASPSLLISISSPLRIILYVCSYKTQEDIKKMIFLLMC